MPMLKTTIRSLERLHLTPLQLKLVKKLIEAERVNAQLELLTDLKEVNHEINGK